MRLTDLDPRWCYHAGKRIGFIFRCPLEPSNARRLQSVFIGGVPREVQWAAGEEALGKDSRPIVQYCNPDESWSCTPDLQEATFENISVMPSLDGTKGGNWHGHITKGMIVGGLAD